MSLQDKISENAKQALRAGDKKRLSALRMMLSELGAVRASGKEFDEVAVLQSHAKKLRNAADEYKRLNVGGKVEELLAEVAVVEEFLPRRMTEQEIEAAVDRAIAENNIAGPKDLGRLMKAVMGQYGGQVDGRAVNAIAQKKLSARE